MRIIPQQQTIFPSENRFQKRILFKGAPEDFGKLLKKYAYKQVPPSERAEIYKSLHKALSEIIDPERLINFGFFNSVYKIDENFVAKIKNSAVNSLWKIGKYCEVGKQTFENLKTYYGQEILDIGGVKFLKNVGEHTPAGIPEIKMKNMDFEELYKYYNEEYLPIFAKVPQKSYDNLVKDYQSLNEMQPDEVGFYYGFDTRNPNNIGLTKDNRLVMMDEIDYRSVPNTNTSGKLLKMFLLSMSRKDSAYDYNQVGKDAAKEIFKKIVLAGEKYNLRHGSDSDAKGLRCWELIFNNFNIKKNAKIFIDQLERNRVKNPDIELRLKKTSEMIDKLFEQK